MQPELAKDGQRLHDLKANLRRGQDIWLQLYQQIFVKVARMLLCMSEAADNVVLSALHQQADH